MVDFDKAAINLFEENFLPVTSGCFFTSPIMYSEKFNWRD